MPQYLPGDVLLTVSGYLDARSVARFSQAHRPMHDILHSDHGGRERFKIEAEKLGMEIGPIPRSLQNVPSATLIDMLKRYCYNLTHLMYQRREIIPLRSSVSTSEWLDHYAPTKERPYFNVHNYMGESGGCFYHVCHRSQSTEARLEIVQFPSIRKGLNSQYTQIEHEGYILGVANDPLQDLVVILTRQPDAENSFAFRFYRLSNATIFRQPFYLQTDWPSNIKVLQFEVCGDRIAINVARWSRYCWDQLYFPLLVINWQTNMLSPVRKHCVSFQFVREDCLALLNWRIHNSGLQVAVESLSFGECFTEGLTAHTIVPLQVPLRREQREALLSVSFVRNAAMPPKVNPEVEDMFEFMVPEVFGKNALPETTNFNGPFHANPNMGLVGIKVEFDQLESKFPDRVWLWERKVFYGSTDRSPEMCQELMFEAEPGYFHTLNGRRLTWYMNGVNARDFDQLAYQRYRTSTSVGVQLNPLDPRWCTTTQVVASPRPRGVGNAWIGDSSVKCHLNQVGHNPSVPYPLRMFTTEDNLVVITHGRYLERPEEIVAAVYTF